MERQLDLFSYIGAFPEQSRGYMQKATRRFTFIGHVEDEATAVGNREIIIFEEAELSSRRTHLARPKT